MLYVGKATSLRSRVHSYLGKDLAITRGPLLVKMIAEAASIEYRKTDSVLEALILEADLIKKFKPPYNTEGKDDKSFNCVVITKEDFPQVLIIRKKDLDSSIIPNSKFLIHSWFGPFPHGLQLQEALKIIRKIFPYRDSKCRPLQGRPCFNRQIGLCPGVCTGEISKEEYAKTIRNIKLLFQNKKGAILKSLERDMKTFAKAREFEKADELKRKIFALQHIQDVALIKRESSAFSGREFRIEAYDVAHISGKEMVAVMTVVSDGTPAKSEYRKFKVKSVYGANDTAALAEALDRRLAHSEWPMPRLIVVDGAVAQKNAAEAVLKKYGFIIPVVAVTKDAYHRPKGILGERAFIAAHEKEILLANSEAHRFSIAFHRKRLQKGFLGN